MKSSLRGPSLPAVEYYLSMGGVFQPSERQPESTGGQRSVDTDLNISSLQHDMYSLEILRDVSKYKVESGE